MWLRTKSEASSRAWKYYKMTGLGLTMAQFLVSYLYLFVSLAQCQGQVEWTSYALGPNTEVWTPNMPAIRTPRAGQQRRFHLPPPPATLRPPAGPPQFPSTRTFQSNIPNQNSGRKHSSLPPQPRTSTGFDPQKNNVHRPISQQPGHLHDSWPKTNAHHHLINHQTPPPSTANSKVWPTKIRLSNSDLRLGPGGGQDRVEDPNSGSMTSDNHLKSHLTPTQKEKIMQMTNTLTKLSPKKPINVFMRYEGIAATRAGADVGQVIKKYAGSSKVPFFNGTLPTGSHLPSVFLSPEDTTPPHGYGKIPIPTLKGSNKGELRKLDDTTAHLVQSSVQVGAQSNQNARADSFLGPASMAAPPGYTKILLPPGSSPVNTKVSEPIFIDSNTKSLNTLTTDEKLRIIQALRQGKTPQILNNGKVDSGYKIVQGPPFDPSAADPLKLLKGMLPQGAIVESIQSLGGGGDTRMAGSIVMPQVMKPPNGLQFSKQQQDQLQFRQQQWSQSQQQHKWPATQQLQQQRPPVQQTQQQLPQTQQFPPMQNLPQMQQPNHQRLQQPNAQQNFGNLNRVPQNVNSGKQNGNVVVNAGIQISLPKVQDGGFNENELTKIIGAIVKQTEGPSSTTPIPFSPPSNQQQWPQLNNPQQRLPTQTQKQPPQQWQNWNPSPAPTNQNPFYQVSGNMQAVPWQQNAPQSQAQMGFGGPGNQGGQMSQGHRPQSVGSERPLVTPTPMNHFPHTNPFDPTLQKQTIVFPPGNKTPQNLFPFRGNPQPQQTQNQQQSNKPRPPVLIPPPPTSTPNPPRLPPAPTEVKVQGIPIPLPTANMENKGQFEPESQPHKPGRPPLLQTALSFLGIQSSTGIPPVISGKPMGSPPRRPSINQSQERRPESPNQSQERRPVSNQVEEQRPYPKRRPPPPPRQDTWPETTYQNSERPPPSNHERNHGGDVDPEDSDSSESVEVEMKEKSPASTTILLNNKRPVNKGRQKHRPPQTIVIQGGDESNLGNLRRIITSLNEDNDEVGSEEERHKPSEPQSSRPGIASPSPGSFGPSVAPGQVLSTPMPSTWQHSRQPLSPTPTPFPPLLYPSSSPRPPGLLPVVSSPFPPFTLLNPSTPRPLFQSSTPFYSSPIPINFISTTPGTYVVKQPQPITLLNPGSQGHAGSLFTVTPTDFHASAVQNVIRQNIGLAPIPSPTSFLYNPTAGTLTPIQPVSPSQPAQTVTYQLVTRPPTTIPTTTETTTTSATTTTSTTTLPPPQPTTTERVKKTSSEETSNTLQKGTKKHNDKKRTDDRIVEKVRTEEKITWNGPVPSKIRTQERTIIRPHQTAQSIRHEERVKFDDGGKSRQQDSDPFNSSDEEQPFTTVPTPTRPTKPSKETKSSTRTEGSTGQNHRSESHPFSNEKEEPLKSEVEESTKRAVATGTSFSELLTSKMKFEKMKEQLYPHHPVSPMPTAMGGWPVFESFPTQPFAPIQVTEPTTTTEMSTTFEPLDPNGRHRIRPGDVTNSRGMTPITSITPSHFDPAFQHYLASQQHTQDQYSYLMGTTPQSVVYNSIPGTQYMFPYHQRSPEHNQERKKDSDPNPPTTAGTNEKLLFIPSGTGSRPTVKLHETKEEERLLFFPSSSPIPDFENGSPSKPRNSGLEITNENIQVIGDTPIWEPFRNAAPNTEVTTTTSTTTMPSTVTTTLPTTTTQSTTTTLATTTTQKATTTNKPRGSDDPTRPSTWRPPHSHTSTPVTTPTPSPQPISNHERLKASAIGAGTLHALMRSMTLQPLNNQWEDTSHMEPKDIGASVLYAVSNGLPMPAQQSPILMQSPQNGAHFQNHMLMQPDSSGMLQQPLVVHYQLPMRPLGSEQTSYMPSPSASPQTQFSFISPSAQPHFGILSPSAQPQQNFPSHLAQPDYNMVSSPAQYNPGLQSVAPQYSLASPSTQPQLQDFYNYQWENQSEEATAAPTTTMTPRREDDDRPRYRTRYRIPPGTQTQEDPQKLIPVYVHKTRRPRIRTTTPSTTTTESNFSNEYEDDIASDSKKNESPREEPNRYESLADEKLHLTKDFQEERQSPIRFVYDFNQITTQSPSSLPPEKESSEETIYEVRVKSPTQVTPRFTKFSSGSDESNEVDMTNYFHVARTTTSTTTTTKPKKRKGSRRSTTTTSTTTTPAPESDESESESEEDETSEKSHTTLATTTTAKSKRRRRPPQPKTDSVPTRVLPPFKTSQTASDYRKSEANVDDKILKPEEFLHRLSSHPENGYYEVTRQESVVSKQGAVHFPKLNQPSPSYYRQTAQDAVERDMFLLSAEDPNGSKKQDLVSSEDKGPFRLRSEGNNDGDSSSTPTFKEAAMSLLNSNLVVKKTGPTMEFLSEVSLPTQATTTTTTPMPTTTTTQKPTTTTTEKPTTVATTTTTQKPTTTKIKVKTTTMKPSKSKPSKKIKAEKLDGDLKAMLKTLQNKIQATGGLSDYADLGSAMLDYYDPDDLLETLKKPTKKKPTKKINQKSVTKKSNSKKTKTVKSTAAPMKKVVQKVKKSNVKLPLPKMTTSIPPTVIITTVSTTTPTPTTSTTTLAPFVTSQLPPNYVDEKISVGTSANGTTESTAILNNILMQNPTSSERRRIRVVRRRRPKPFALPNTSYQSTFIPNAAPIVAETTVTPILQTIQNIYSSRAGEVEGEPVRRRLRLVRTGNRAQWKLGEHLESDRREGITLPLVSSAQSSTNHGERHDKSVRLESSSIGVETRVCVRGKCEIVTKN